MNGQSENKEGPWQIAKKCSDQLGRLPPAFPTAIRMLVWDQLNNNQELRPLTKYQVARILKGENFRSMLYFASLDLKEEELEEAEILTVGTLMGFYKPLDLAALIGNYVLFRKCRRVFTHDGWAWIVNPLKKDCWLGAYVGASIPKIGIGAGLMLGSLHHFGRGLLLMQDENAYIDYHNYLKAKDISLDLDQEEKLWGCSSLEVAALLLSVLGFGVEVSQDYIVGFDPRHNLGEVVDSLQYTLKVGSIWMECFRMGREQPASEFPAELFPNMRARQKYIGKYRKTDLSSKHWFERRANDLTAEIAPKFFEAEIPQKKGLEVPEQLQDVFSLDEITAMEEEDFDDLIDQLDLEQGGVTARGSETLAAKDIDELEDMLN